MGTDGTFSGHWKRGVIRATDVTAARENLTASWVRAGWTPLYPHRAGDDPDPMEGRMEAAGLTLLKNRRNQPIADLVLFAFFRVNAQEVLVLRRNGWMDKQGVAPSEPTTDTSPTTGEGGKKTMFHP